jgi:hypothetical protein
MLSKSSKISVIILSAIISIPLITQAAKPGEEPTPSSNYQFVGFSTAEVTAAVGYFGLAQACQADFGPLARIATTKEISESIIQPTLTAVAAWVQGLIVEAVPQGTSNLILFDYTGIRSPEGNCDGWLGTGGSGLAVKPNGGITPISCSASIPVSCSAPT